MGSERLPCPGPQVTSDSVSLPCPAPLRAPSFPLILRVVRAFRPRPRPRRPGTPGPAAWVPIGRPGSGRGWLGRQARGQVRCGAGGSFLPGRGHAGPGRVLSSEPGSPLLRGPLAPRWEPRKGDAMGSVRSARSRARGLAVRYLPLGASPPPSLEVPRVTAAAARQLLLPAPRPTPGRWEVRPCLAHGVSASGDSFADRALGLGQARGQAEPWSEPGTEVGKGGESPR